MRLSPTELNALRQEARRTRQPIGAIIKSAVRRYLAEYKDEPVAPQVGFMHGGHVFTNANVIMTGTVGREPERLAIPPTEADLVTA